MVHVIIRPHLVGFTRFNLVREAVIARPRALISRVKPTNVWSNSFSAVRRQSDSGRAKCALATSRFSSLGRFEGAILTSAHAECASGGSPLLPHVLLAVKQVASEHYLITHTFLCITR